VPFEVIEPLKLWMIELQAGRRNLNDAWRYNLHRRHLSETQRAVVG